MTACVGAPLAVPPPRWPPLTPSARARPPPPPYSDCRRARSAGAEARVISGVSFGRKLSALPGVLPNVVRGERLRPNVALTPVHRPVTR